MNEGKVRERWKKGETQTVRDRDREKELEGGKSR